MNKVAFHVAAVLGLMANASVCGAVDLNREIDFIIPAQKLDAALMQFSRQAKIQVIASTPNLEEFLTTGASGNLTIGEALKKLLGSSGLAFKKIGEETVAIVPAQSETVSTRFEQTSTALSLSPQESYAVRLARLERQASTEGESGHRVEVADGQEPIRLEEILVTGSHIRGSQNFTSPVITFDRKDIEHGGFATTQQLVQSIPQNLSNISDTTFSDANGGVGFSYEGSGFNLRGLGGDSTLVLLNGRRMAAAGRGGFSDISLIPLSAIERVEVLTDGASAIYGSDAVGGVVNLILRKDYEGAETRLRYGSVTQGSHEELQAGQMFGHTWGSGRMLLGYEFYDRTDLDGEDRDFVQPDGYLADVTLIPNQRRHGAFATVTHRLNERAEISGDFFFGRRRSSSSYDLGIPLAVDVEGRLYSGSGTLSVDVAAGWQARLSGLFSNSNSAQEDVVRATGELFSEHGTESRLRSFDLAADGPVARLAGGDARLAVGLQYRDERYTEKFPSYPAALERDVAAVYAELHMPWISSLNSRPGLERLELTVAARLEDYSDFGTSVDPKLGMAWAPTSGLNLRASWGTSFKAPLLSQMNPENLQVTVHQDRFIRDSSLVTGMTLFGSGVALDAERSKNWTVGMDLQPAAVENLSLSATYFAIEYEDRIKTPLPSGYNPYGILHDPIYAAIIDTSPDPGYVATLLNHPNAICFTPDFNLCAPQVGDIDVVVDRRLRNLAALRTNGIDLTLSYELQSALGHWSFQVSGSQLLHSVERLVPNAPETNLLNNVWQPADLRVRNSTGLVRGDLGVFAHINYTDGYRDRRANSTAGPLQRARVSSWTTVDLAIQYSLRGAANGGLGQSAITFTATNVFDRDPPFISSPMGLYFDGVNANPLGRFIAAQFVVQW